jgi:hypothetical protein
MIHLLGIRHHGPGSAKSVVNALHHLKPDLILLEGTIESDALLANISDPGLKPPVAILIYNPRNLSQAVYYPYAHFSPEWQTIKYSLENNVKLINFDLPLANRFAIEDVRKNGAIEFKFPEEPENEHFDNKLLRADPLGFIAKLAGYEDRERWWEVTIEQHADNPPELFNQIVKLISALRENEKNTNSEDLLREAYMRTCLRDALKSGYKNIAVVCGAWHTAALHLEKFDAKTDKQLLHKLPKIKTASTWIPWTYDRLSKSSGYGAGVISPAWYELIFDKKEDAVIEWMSSVAQLLRAEDLDASSAQVIDAVRLADTLATLRGIKLPGIEELTEAAQTTFSGGEAALQLIARKLIIGDVMGEVPVTIPVHPIQEDIEIQIKQLRLSKYKFPKSHIHKDPDLELDLRKQHDRNQSIFLHRLLLLEIPWGSKRASKGTEKTTKNEYWDLSWQPEFIIKIIEAGTYGNTLRQAANNFCIKKATVSEKLRELSILFNLIIKADLIESSDFLIEKLKSIAALTTDIQSLLETIPDLIYSYRYGDVRNSDNNTLKNLIEDIIPRICAGLNSVCQSLDDDSSEQMLRLILSANRSFNILEENIYEKQWFRALEQITTSNNIHGKIKGLASRLLMDSDLNNMEQTADIMSFELSVTANLKNAADWLDGFMQGTAMLLIHHPLLWNILDNWISEMSEDNFIKLIPLIRRSFAKFSQPEREKLLELAKYGSKPIQKSTQMLHFDSDRAKIAAEIYHFIYQ